MSSDIGIAPDAAQILYRHVLRLFPEEDQDMVHLHFLPDGYNCHKDGLAIVVADDPGQDDETTHVRDLVRVSVYGPEHGRVRKLGRNMFTALTSGLTGVGLGVDRKRSSFFGSGPSYQPTGFVSTMSISVGLAKWFAALD